MTVLRKTFLRNLLPLIPALGLVFGTAACDSALEEDVRSQVASDYLSTEEGFDSAVNGVYEALRDFYGKEVGATLTVFGTDTFQEGSDGSWKFFDSYTAQLNPTAGFLNDVWNNMYVGINAANAVVGRSANGVEGFSEEEVTERIAEARFLRAHYYFILLRTFGRVHLTLEETQGIQTEATRAPIADIYDAITSDLEFAIENLPVEPREYGRATKPAAEQMLAKVLLRRGYGEAAQPDDYERAAALAEGVIDNYDFRLLDNFGDVFDMDNQQNDEVVWAVQYSQEPLLNGGGNNVHLYFLMEYDVLAGMSRNLRDGRPWKRFRPTEFTLETLFADRENDVRYDESFKTAFLTTNPGTYTIDGVQVDLAEGDTAIWLPGYDMSQAEQQALPYQVITPDEYTDKLYPTLTKYLDPQRADVNAEAGSRDVLLYRLAGTHFIAAEALLMLGRTSEAEAHVNAVRLRAARADENGDEAAAEDALRITEDDLDLNFLLDERGRELLGEMHRWFTLTRTGTLVERVRAHNPFGGPNIQDYHALRPIPQDQIDRTTTEFPQNPSY